MSIGYMTSPFDSSAGWPEVVIRINYQVLDWSGFRKNKVSQTLPLSVT